MDKHYNAPEGKIEMAGSDNTTLNGNLFRNTVKVKGAKPEIRYDDSLFPDVSKLSLIE
jgi:hypothetical protein